MSDIRPNEPVGVAGRRRVETPGLQPRGGTTGPVLSRLVGDARSIAQAVRSHRGIENQVHWVLDVAFREDASRARIRHSTTNLALIRTLALILLRSDPTRRIGIKGSRRKAGWDDTYLLHVLGVHASDEMP